MQQPARNSKGYERKDVCDESGVVIEKVLASPEPALFSGETNANLHMLMDQLADFRTKVPDHQAFHQQLTREHAKLQRILQVKPELGFDFQSLIDVSGNLYLIDLDGHLSLSQRQSAKEQIDCRIEKLLHTVDQVKKNLTATRRGYESTVKIKCH